MAVGTEVSLILWGWAAAQYPDLIPPLITIRVAAAPTTTLTTLVLALGIGALLWCRRSDTG